ncbi:conserved hypothetical protein [Frankia canadensis]|uniref:GGDEF domain-containing protein n=1 Tax=Frankia canadensis TaxID=1836972 RepID=A0A2I2KRS3_9ACTN|nr:type III-B CRISPR-associated protein Cas10/Cmr2 [Frankia canadensis]SNQ48371.1 conserved hypothetical protein [Frankia canadensis]SOU55661.1 conserved hypothetical protein [Frankia canadensis]
MTRGGQDADGYVLLTLGGVQPFIAASRRTADLWAASQVMSRLCQVAVQAIRRHGGEPVLPSAADSADGLPNRLFAVAPAGHDPALIARSAAVEVRQTWRELAALTFPSPNLDVLSDLDTMPTLRWVSWTPPGPDAASPGHPADPGRTAGPQDAAYARGWAICQAASGARRRVRDFPGYVGRGAQPCSLCGLREGLRKSRGENACRPVPGLPGPPGHPGPGGEPTGLPSTLRVTATERLCPVCAVKRDSQVADTLLGSRAAFPSTATVATAPFRLAVLVALARPGGDADLAAALTEHRLALIDVVGALHDAGAADARVTAGPSPLPVLESAAAEAGGPARGWVRMDGSWSLPDTWQPESLLHEYGLRPAAVDAGARSALSLGCARGRAAVRTLRACLSAADAAGDLDDTDDRDNGVEAAGVRPDGVRPDGVGADEGAATYLALLVQDADGMGRALDPARNPTALGTRAWHESVSRALVEVAGRQSEALEELSGRAVYAGGDDLLGMVPAVHALRAARRCRELFLAEAVGLLRRPSVCSAIVYFHASYPLQDALVRAREALEEAKRRPGKNSLSVVVVRRGGEKAAIVLPWRGRGGAEPTVSLDAVVAAFRGELSPRLVASLHGSRYGIASLAGDGLDYPAEVRRLVARHLAGGAGSEAERYQRSASFTEVIRTVEPPVDRLSVADVESWVDALAIARFLVQEGR